jgi:hypothetical protein
MYQWLSERASFFRFGKSGRGASHNVCTGVTVERESITLLVSGPSAIFDVCPLCGTKLAPEQVEPSGLRRQKNSINNGEAK